MEGFLLSTTKKLTEAALLSSLFIVSTIIAVGTGLGYGIYLDFVVPIFFCIICLKCEIKYTILSSISSVLIVSLVLGNLGTAIWITQGMILGILCGFLMSRATTILDDMVYGSFIGIIIMIFIDIYASALIGYRFMQEFQGYANFFVSKFNISKEIINIGYYIVIALFPFGMVFSVYYLSLIVGKKLNVLKGNSKKKLLIIHSFRSCGRFICCSKKVFYGCVVFIFTMEIITILGIQLNTTYVKTVLISTKYLCYYFVIRDGYTSVQNFILSKYQKVSYARILTVITVILLVLMFRITAITLIILNIILDKKINIRIRQTDIINSYANSLMQK